MAKLRSDTCENWTKLDKIGQNWTKLGETRRRLKLDEIGRKLSKIYENWVKLEKTGQNWAKLGETR